MDHTPENIDRYITDLFAPEAKGANFEGALASTAEAGMPTINVSASAGKLMQTLAVAVGARRILEIGTLGGYSGLWLAGALPEDGKLISLELEPKHAEVARASFARAGISDKVEVRVGPALQSLEEMVRSGEPLFDVTFLDADKEGYVEYLKKALVLTRKGGLIMADNALSHNALEGDPNSPIGKFNQALAETPGLISALVPTMHHGRIDGFTVSVVL